MHVIATQNNIKCVQMQEKTSLYNDNNYDQILRVSWLLVFVYFLVWMNVLHNKNQYYTIWQVFYLNASIPNQNN